MSMTNKKKKKKPKNAFFSSSLTPNYKPLKQGILIWKGLAFEFDAGCLPSVDEEPKIYPVVRWCLEVKNK